MTNLKRFIKVRKHPSGEEVEEEYIPSGDSESFSPSDLDHLALWLDASRFEDLNDGDPINTWPDLSGNGYDATTEGTGPTFSIDYQNGLPMAVFDGSSDPLEFLTALNMLSEIEGFTIALATVRTNEDTGNDDILIAKIGSDALLSVQDDLGTVDISLLVGPTIDGSKYVAVIAEGAAGSPPQRAALARCYAMDLLQAVGWWQGSLLTNDQGSGGNGADLALSPSTPADYIHLPEGSGYTGALGELIIYTRMLSLGERRQVLEYLSNKWHTI